MLNETCAIGRAVWKSAVLTLMGLQALGTEAFRPPAVPLVACDPYFSIWSPADKLTDADTVHWTGKPHRLTMLARIDNKPFRVMGTQPTTIPPLPQVALEVLPTRTIYTFEAGGLRLMVTFMTPMLPDDMELLSRPVTYVTCQVQAIDGKRHSFQNYFDASPEIAVNHPGEDIEYKTESVAGLSVLGVGSVEQSVLGKKGDDIRIDWGHFYVGIPNEFMHTSASMNPETARALFVKNGDDDWKWSTRSPNTATNGAPVLGCSFQYHGIEGIGREPVSRWLILAYDDEFSIQYMRKNLRPYWRRNGDDAAALLKKAAAEYESLKKRCEAFDAELMADLQNAGGEHYARLGALAYRQCFAAGKFVADANGQPLQFCKENHSNGCIGTSDVFYPMAPQFLLFGATQAKSLLVPFMNYAASERWKFPFAPHDLGTYPKANGQVYGGGERTQENQMPVEESGNLLILLAAVAQMEGHAEFARLYWKQLEQWAEYLKAKGFDPENQLCTDDFAGHLAHNVNLSAKAIIGLGSFAKLCELRGRAEKSDELSAKARDYFQVARGLAQRWVKEADDGGHLRLAFDKPGTWSQKYNLIWDRILGLELFPAEVARSETDYYKQIQNRYGLPLDNRKDYTKLDWISWTATLTQNRADFEALLDPVYRFLNETPDRSPMTDWYETSTAKKVGFTARPVVGGVFAQLLYDKAVWKKWANRDQTKAANWAAMPKAPKLQTVVPAADMLPAMWRFTTLKPATNWFEPDFEAPAWKEGPGGFGTAETPGARVGTKWDGSDIWLRREVELPKANLPNLMGWLHHDEDAEIYINGVLALRVRGFSTSYESYELNGRGTAALKAGKNMIAVHCHQTTGGQYIDLGLVAAERN